MLQPTNDGAMQRRIQRPRDGQRITRPQLTRASHP